MHRHVWEPSLTELYEDPVLHLLLKRDGLRLADVKAAVEAAVEALAAPDDKRAIPAIAAE